MTWWGVDISNLAYIFRSRDASLSEIFPLARRECHGGRLPKAEQEVFYSEIECSLIWVGNHHKPHMARCEAPHFIVQKQACVDSMPEKRYNTTMLVFMQNDIVLEQDVFNMG